MDGDLSEDTTVVENKYNVISQTEFIEAEIESSSTCEVENVVLEENDEDMPGIVVISHDTDSAEEFRDVEKSEEPPNKRILLEKLGHDGQTYVLTLRDGTEEAEDVKFDSKSQTGSLSEDERRNTDTDSEDPKSTVNKAWFTNRDDKSSSQPNPVSSGQLWKQGMWAKEETDLLQHNIDQYCKDHGINDPTEIIFEMTKDERKDFYRSVAKGLNRPLFAVYRRVIRLYDRKNHIGKYTPEEIERLKELRTKHGNDWQAIGTALGRSASSIKDRCRLMKENCNTGKWLPSEERRLTEAVYQLSQSLVGEMVTSGISWSAVAEKVGTRSEKQCRTKWLNYLNWKQAGGTEWTREDDIKLICKLYSSGVTDENAVDWTEFAKGWSSVRSPQWLRGKWWNLKRHVPDAQSLAFREICESLYKNHAQALKLKPNDDLTLSPVSEVSRTSLNIPRVSVMQAPTIMHAVPLHVQTEVQTTPSTTAGATGEDDRIISTSLGASFQAFEVLPSNMRLTHTTGQPTTFLITPAQTIPFASCTPNSTGQIIIQALPPEALHGSDDVTVQMTMPSQIIISTGSGPSTTFASLNTTGLTTPIHLTRPLLQHNGMQIDSLAAQAATVLTSVESGELLSTEINTNKLQDAENSMASQTDMITQELEGEERDLETTIESAQEGTSVALETSSSHLILSDPMLSSSNSPELIGASVATGNEQQPEDSLDTEGT